MAEDGTVVVDDVTVEFVLTVGPFAFIDGLANGS